MKPVSSAKPRNGLVAALDLGSTKTSCLIARVTPATSDTPAKARIAGIGHQRSHGVRSGGVVDLDAVESTIRSTVERAEDMVGENIERVIVGLSCGKPASRIIEAEVDVAGHEIGEADLQRVLDPDLLARQQPEDTDIIHAIPVGYRVDDNGGIRDPRGMFGHRLGANLHMVTALKGPKKNLETVIARCHLEVDTFVAAPYASALSTLVEDERQLGVTCIDMGGGTTSIAIYFDGEPVHTDVIAVGGQHMTNDIARGLSTPLEQAERMKTLFGCVIPSPSDDAEMINVPLIGEERSQASTQVPRSMLVGIIRPRAEEILELIRDRLKASGFERSIGQRLVLTGGGSQLAGMADLAGQILGRDVRRAKPHGVDGLADAISGPGHATCVGLIRYAMEHPPEVTGRDARVTGEQGGAFGRFGQWFKENFL